jgi:REP element-mobilizing transposase RayT
MQRLYCVPVICLDERGKPKVKFQGKYRIDSTRLPGWDYASAGYYFVTICTKNRVCFFGRVIDGSMHLSSVGKVAHCFWTEIPQHHANVALDAFMVMPNHVHGIIVIQRTKPAHQVTLGRAAVSQVAQSRCATFAARSPRSGSLGAIIRSYKAAVTHQVRQNELSSFAWHSRFYDQIIRDRNHLSRVRQYIRDNPMKWHLDRYHPSKPQL